MTISEVTDGNRTVFALYQEQMQGRAETKSQTFTGSLKQRKMRVQLWKI